MIVGILVILLGAIGFFAMRKVNERPVGDAGDLPPQMKERIKASQNRSQQAPQ